MCHSRYFGYRHGFMGGNLRGPDIAGTAEEVLDHPEARKCPRLPGWVF